MAEDASGSEGFTARALAELALCENLLQTSAWAARWSADLAHAEAALLWVPDAIHPVFLCVATHGEGTKAFLRRSAQRDSGVVRDLLRDRKALAFGHDQIVSSADPWLKGAAKDARACLAVPLEAEGVVVALLGLFFNTTPATRETLARLQSFLEHAAPALARELRSERKTVGMLHAIERLTNLYDLSKAFGSTIEWEELTDLIARKGADLGVAEVASLWMFDDGAEEVTLAATSVNENYEIDEPPDSVGATLAGDVLADQAAVLQNNVAPDAPIATENPGYAVRSVLAVPLVEDERPIGALVLVNKRGRHPEFTSEDEELIQDLGRQAVRALRNARQYEAEKKVEELDALLTVSREITSTLDISRVMGTIVNATSALIAYDRCAIAILEKGRLRLGAVSGVEQLDRKTPEHSRLEALLDWVFLGGSDAEVRQEEDGSITTDRPETQEKFKSYFTESGMRSFFGAILKDDEGKLGVLSFESAAPLVFGAETRDILQILVNQATVAVRNAQLYQQVPLVGFLKPLARSRRRLQEIPRSRRLTWALGLAATILVLVLVPWRLRLSGPARVLPGKRAAVTTAVDGVVKEVLKREGERVAAGDVIATLRNEGYVAALAEARAGLTIAESAASRAQDEGNAAALFQAQSRRDELRARVELETENLEWTRVKAPIAGTIVTPRIEERVGQNLTRGAELCVVADVGSVTAEVAIAEEDVTLLAPKQPADLKLNPFATQTFHGNVSLVGARVREEGRVALRHCRGGARQPGRVDQDRDGRPRQDPRGDAPNRGFAAAPSCPLVLVEGLASASVSPARGTTRLAAAAHGGEEARSELARRHGGPGDRPGLRKDLVVRRVIQMGEPRWIVKCPDPLDYYSFDEPIWGLVELFDGSRTRHEIHADYVAAHPGDEIEFKLVLEYEDQLRKMHLLERSASEKSLALFSLTREARQKAAQQKAEGFNPFFIMFHVFDPDPLLNKTAKYVRWLWRPPVVIASLFAFAWTVGVFVQHWGPVWSGTVELYAFLRKPLLDAVQFFLILSVIGFFHEMSHAYATKFYGGDVHDIGIALLYFTPAFYCNTTDSLLFTNKWHSLWVTTAGIYVEAWMCTIATFLWVVSYPDTLLNELAYKTMLFTGASTIFFNINPLIKIDGYYALTSLLEISELREESMSYLGALLQRRILRLPVEVPEASARKKRIYWAFGVPALLWVGVIMRFIGGLFYNLYEKYFPEAAPILLAATLVFIFKRRVKLVWNTAHLFYLDKKELLMSPKSKRNLFVLAVVLLAIFVVPWGRRRISTEAVFRPATVVRLEAPEEGVVEEVLGRESDAVEPGQPLFRISSPDRRASEARFAGERGRSQRAATAARNETNSQNVLEASMREASASAGLASERARGQRMAVTSPIAGRVLTRRIEDLQGTYVLAGTLLAEVGDVRHLVADLPVTERLVGDISIGSPVRAFVPEEPMTVIAGRVLRISTATLDRPATATAADSASPPERPDRFAVVAEFDNSDGRLKPGALVRAKIYGERTSYAARSWRVLRRWVQRMLW